MFRTILTWLTGGGLRGITDQLLAAYEAKLKAENDEQAREAQILIERLETQRAIAVIEAADRWSALRVGRWLIVVPFGLWWSAIFADSIFSFTWDVLALPDQIWDLAFYLIPAILLGDVTQFGIRQFKR